MISWHKVGQRVVVMKPFVRYEYYSGDVLPEVGAVYTIREVYAPLCYRNRVYFYLAEIQNPLRSWRNVEDREAPFLSEYFAPIYPTQVSEIIRQALDVPVKEKERA